MRKIDAVLLSALILYDYSAQSLVDNDAISFGKSFIISKLHDNKLTDPGFEFSPEFKNDAVSTARGVKRINPTSNIIENKDNNISYYELAKLKPETTTDVVESIESSAINNQINIVRKNTSRTISLEETAIPESVSFKQTSVAMHRNVYSGIAEMSASKITGHVANEADMSTLDSDNDGTYDIDDKCPGVAGVARFEGCPVPDSDADGVNDEEDRCPFKSGSSDNYGCPIVVAAQHDISAVETQVQANNDNSHYAFTLSFQTGSKILSTDDFNIVLRITDILIQKPDAKVEIDGNTLKNNYDSETPVEKLVHYFRELGVKDSQIVIKTKTQHINNTSESNKLYLRLII